MKRYPTNVTLTPTWRMADALLLQRMMDDLETIVDAGGLGEFETVIAEVRHEAWEQREYAKMDGSLEASISLVTQLATELGFDCTTAIVLVAWRRHRAPMRRLATMIHSEADRIRAGKRGAR